MTAKTDDKLKEIDRCIEGLEDYLFPDDTCVSKDSLDAILLLKEYRAIVSDGCPRCKALGNVYPKGASDEKRP
ncbi:MAG TPA: hypothetical protein PLZ78_09045 [Spirochaetota bacterium]|nr:hypothetical protein [Spirochaetota bacterium]